MSAASIDASGGVRKRAISSRMAKATDAGAAPTLDDIGDLAERALGQIPARMRKLVADVVIRVEEFPDDEVVAEMALESPFDLLGLYRGVSLDRKSHFDADAEPDMVFLYRRPILDYWCEGSDSLAAVVRHVLIHEIGHHFGFSDADMEAIEGAAAD